MLPGERTDHVPKPGRGHESPRKTTGRRLRGIIDQMTQFVDASVNIADDKTAHTCRILSYSFKRRNDPSGAMVKYLTSRYLERRINVG
jgi:hypothetical protein